MIAICMYSHSQGEENFIAKQSYLQLLESIQRIVIVLGSTEPASVQPL